MRKQRRSGLPPWLSWRRQMVRGRLGHPEPAGHESDIAQGPTHWQEFVPAK